MRRTVYMKSALKWYRLAKDGTEVERYVRSVQGQESVRLVFCLRTGSAGLLENMKRYKMVSDEVCVMCDRRNWGGCGSFSSGLWEICEISADGVGRCKYNCGGRRVVE